MKKQIEGSLALIVATLIWGTTFVAQSMGMDHIGPFTFQAARCILGCLFLLPVIAISDRFTNKNDTKSFFTRWCDKQLWQAGLCCGIPLFIACNAEIL